MRLNIGQKLPLDWERTGPGAIQRRQPLTRFQLGACVLALSVLSLLCVPHTHAQKLYKWVDENGQVTYSQRPPPKSADGTEVQLRGLGGAPPATEDGANSVVEKAETARKDREFRESVKDEESQRADQFKKNCEVARQNLRLLRDAPRLKTTDKEGKEVFVPDSERATRVEAAQKQIKDYCR